MESKIGVPLGRANTTSPSFGDRGFQVGFLSQHKYSEGKKKDKMTQGDKCPDPSCPGTLIHTHGMTIVCEFNPAQYHLLKQLYNATKSPYI